MVSAHIVGRSTVKETLSVKFREALYKWKNKPFWLRESVEWDSSPSVGSLKRVVDSFLGSFPDAWTLGTSTPFLLGRLNKEEVLFCGDMRMGYSWTLRLNWMNSRLWTSSFSMIRFGICIRSGIPSDSSILMFMRKTKFLRIIIFSYIGVHIR